jgi:hypothetical protein
MQCTSCAASSLCCAACVAHVHTFPSDPVAGSWVVAQHSSSPGRFDAMLVDGWLLYALLNCKAWSAAGQQPILPDGQWYVPLLPWHACCRSSAVFPSMRVFLGPCLCEQL